jgi:hypothetical protein
MFDEPDYSTYSLPDLYDVTQHIDRQRFPQRYDRVRQEIATREASAVPRKAIEESMWSYIEKGFRGVQVGALLISFTSLFWIATGIAAPFFGFNLMIGLPLEFERWNEAALNSSYGAIVLFFSLGGLSLLFSHRVFLGLLAAGYLLVSLQVKIGEFIWWPYSSSSGLFFGFTSSALGEIQHSIRLVAIPFFLALWSAVMIVRREQSDRRLAEGAGEG